MNDEIKEILDKLKNGFCSALTYEKLLDYITNLQEENEFLKLNNPEMNIEHFRIVKENKRKIDNLRKENERLKEELKNRPIVDFTFDTYKELEQKDKEIERLNKKYDKALELLQDFNMPCECVNCKIPDEYCEENCSVDCECYKKCWNKYIELELKEGK